MIVMLNVVVCVSLCVCSCVSETLAALFEKLEITKYLKDFQNEGFLTPSHLLVCKRAEELKEFPGLKMRHRKALWNWISKTKSGT